MSIAVHVRTPCRLHFGMLSFGRLERPQFGGIGAMIEPPCVEVHVSPAAVLEVQGSLADRATQFAELAMTSWQLTGLPPCRIEVRTPTDHAGLGVGTQLGLTVAAGLRRFLQLPDLTVELLAASVGRGKRSAVGMYGFQQGGLIVDAGKHPDDKVGKLAERVDVPAEWRFVLVCSRNTQGLAGKHEAAAFAGLPPVSDAVTQSLWQITNDEMLPALKRGDCEAFGDAVFRYGRLAGECFAPAQGGPFASTQIAHLVESIRDFGIRGVGQSSWGPTVFAVTANEPSARDLATWLSKQSTNSDCELTIARPNNTGAVIT